MSLKYAEFNAYLEKNPKQYATLNKYRKNLIPDKSKQARRKLKAVEVLMQAKLNDGLSTKRRKVGTGTRVIEKRVYKDTPGNRRAKRVGEEYDKVTYQDAEFEVRKRTKMRRRKRQPRNPDAPPRRNLWIESVQESKKQLNSPAFVIVRSKITDPDSEAQQIGFDVYTLAKKIMAVKKEAAALEKAAAAAEKAAATETTSVDEVDSAESASEEIVFHKD